MFPSPTGVTYYESLEKIWKEILNKGFRPQQGLLIMNQKKDTKEMTTKKGFRPQQGLLIMNYEVYQHVWTRC